MGVKCNCAHQSRRKKSNCFEDQELTPKYDQGMLNVVRDFSFNNMQLLYNGGLFQTYGMRL